jgi:two-component system sensor histidine kinase DesK
VATRTPDRTGARTRVPRRPAAAGRTTRRRFRSLNLTVFLPLFTAVGALLVARQAQTWTQACVLALGVLAALLAFERWTAGDLARVAVPCLCVTAAVWPYGVLVIDGAPGSAYFPLALVSSLVVPQLPRHRAAAAVAVVGYVIAVGVLGMLATTPAGAEDLIDHVLLPGGFTAVLVGAMFPNQRFYDVVADLEAERGREAELAVMRERMRFAGDLHDIQGHTLHVVKLKVALAQRLVRTDTDRAEQELREVSALVGDTITRTRELAYGQRELNLAAELENARNLLEAAGIRVHVDRRDDAGVPGIELLGQVLRETTTNVLRHSRATQVSIALEPRSITVVNDGVLDEAQPQLRGLAALAHRVAEEGGRLTVRQEGGRFRTAASFLPAAGAVDR